MVSSMAAAFRQSILTLLPIMSLAFAQGGQHVLSNNNDMSEVYDKLSASKIIPDVIYDFQPVLGLSAEWKSDVASLGNTLKPSNLQSAPSVRLEKAEPEDDLAEGMTYVLALTDPDAPSHDDPKWSEFCHWITTGVPSPSKAAAIADLKDVIEYKPPGPPPKTGKHRYVFLAFVPANGTTEELHLSKPTERKHWGWGEAGHGVQDWARDNGLVPVAANFIYAQNEKQ